MKFSSFVFTLVCCLGACGKSKDMVDTKAAEQSIISGIKSNGGEVKTIACPPSVEFKEGGTFECSGALADGKSLLMQATMTNRTTLDFKILKVDGKDPVVAGSAAPAADPHAAAPTPTPTEDTEEKH